jgi:hypothetical protein
MAHGVDLPNRRLRKLRFFGGAGGSISIKAS